MGMPGTTITLMPHNMRHHMVATLVCDLGKERGMEGEGYGWDGRRDSFGAATDRTTGRDKMRYGTEGRECHKLTGRRTLPGIFFSPCVR